MIITYPQFLPYLRAALLAAAHMLYRFFILLQLFVTCSYRILQMPVNYSAGAFILFIFLHSSLIISFPYSIIYLYTQVFFFSKPVILLPRLLAFPATLAIIIAFHNLSKYSRRLFSYFIWMIIRKALLGNLIEIFRGIQLMDILLDLSHNHFNRRSAAFKFHYVYYAFVIFQICGHYLCLMKRIPRFII
ncbi:MAG: hypothetical protein BWY26_00716 [Elusimicrobia bacterium ADurb.Bin231]|nr:MAG: hypothetical protein BWY26_00716 [Elusimicrobia bacterium ADurb.Bin231]